MVYSITVAHHHPSANSSVYAHGGHGLAPVSRATRGWRIPARPASVGRAHCARRRHRLRRALHNRARLDYRIQLFPRAEVPSAGDQDSAATQADHAFGREKEARVAQALVDGANKISPRLIYTDPDTDLRRNRAFECIDWGGLKRVDGLGGLRSRSSMERTNSRHG
jgi:hypothetical protein